MENTYLASKAQKFWQTFMCPNNETTNKTHSQIEVLRIPLTVEEASDWNKIYRRFLNYIEPTDEELERWTKRLISLNPNETNTIFPFESFFNMKSFIKTVKGVVEHKISNDNPETDEDFIPNPILTVDEMEDWKTILNTYGYRNLPMDEELDRWNRRYLTLDPTRVGLDFPYGKYWDVYIFISKVREMLTYWEKFKKSKVVISVFIQQKRRTNQTNNKQCIKINKEMKPPVKQQTQDYENVCNKTSGPSTSCHLCIRSQNTRMPPKSTGQGVKGYLSAPCPRMVALDTRNVHRTLPPQRITTTTTTKPVRNRRILPQVPIIANSRFRYNTIVEEHEDEEIELDVRNEGDGCDNV